MYLQCQRLETFPFLRVQKPLGSLTVFPTTDFLILRCIPECLGAESKCNILPTRGDSYLCGGMYKHFSVSNYFWLMHSNIKIYLLVGYHVIF